MSIFKSIVHSFRSTIAFLWHSYRKWSSESDARKEAKIAKLRTQVELEKAKTQLELERLGAKKELMDAKVEVKKAKAELNEARHAAGEKDLGERISDTIGATMKAATKLADGVQKESKSLGTLLGTTSATPAAKSGKPARKKDLNTEIDELLWGPSAKKRKKKGERGLGGVAMLVKCTAGAVGALIAAVLLLVKELFK